MKAVLEGKMHKILFSLLLCCALIVSCVPATNHTSVQAADPLIVMLDPGHGGEDPGVVRGTNEESVFNLKIVEACKAELATYDNVIVYMTRVIENDISTYERSMYAKQLDADVFISFHINSYSSASVGGAEVYVPCGNYRPQLATKASQLANKILANFTALELPGYGLTNDRLKSRGLKTRNAEDERLEYPDGSKGDYYEVIRMGVRNEIPAMIIEHAYITNPADLKMLQDDAALVKLGQATAKAIAAQYGLTKTGNALEQPVQTGQTQEVFLGSVPSNVTVGDAPFTLTATGGAPTGEYVYYTNNPDIIRIEGDKAYIVGAGEANLRVTRYGGGTLTPRSATFASKVKVSAVQTQLKLSVVENFRANGAQTVVFDCRPATGIQNGAVPSGTVTLYKNQTKVGTGTFAEDGSCRLQVSGITPGNYTFSVSYEAGKFDGFTIANSQSLNYTVEENVATPIPTIAPTHNGTLAPDGTAPTASAEMSASIAPTPEEDGGFVAMLGNTPILIILGVSVVLVAAAIVILIIFRERK
ncbi:MAG: N-acetylmuramoyl-L-alanine amidase [Clostridia bacterium]|nr:N-acetylmuramoyl-L-alanine amidase [Clostridia bacterium]